MRPSVPAWISDRGSSCWACWRELASRYFEGWKKSPGHRRNMLEASVTDTAVAVARSARTGRYYAVQLFGRTAAAGC